MAPQAAPLPGRPRGRSGRAAEPGAPVGGEVGPCGSRAAGGIAGSGSASGCRLAPSGDDYLLRRGTVSSRERGSAVVECPDAAPRRSPVELMLCELVREDGAA